MLQLATFPLSIFFSKKIFGTNIGFFYRDFLQHNANLPDSNDNIKHSNVYLKKKTEEVFNFDQNYLGVFEIMKALKVLTLDYIIIE